MNVEGSVALVTGANRGIGRAIAEELLSRGAAKVYAAVRDVTTVSDSRLVAVELDVTDADRVAAIAAELSDMTVVVNNAGIGRPATALAATLADARAELEANYLGVVSMTTAFAPVLAANGGGAFVNMLSVVSWVAFPRLATYSASKAAAWSYTNAARIALRQEGTHVVGVYVGFVDTDLTAGVDAPKVSPQAVAAAALDALESDAPEALVDDVSKNVKAGLSDDMGLIYPGIEREFAAAA
jgi:NAD(P)-dependent dehydrogenase (short-subunit alcohol dehydrogenase family)